MNSSQNIDFMSQLKQFAVHDIYTQNMGSLPLGDPAHIYYPGLLHTALEIHLFPEKRSFIAVLSRHPISLHHVPIVSVGWMMPPLQIDLWLFLSICPKC